MSNKLKDLKTFMNEPNIGGKTNAQVWQEWQREIEDERSKTDETLNSNEEDPQGSDEQEGNKSAKRSRDDYKPSDKEDYMIEYMSKNEESRFEKLGMVFDILAIHARYGRRKEFLSRLGFDENNLINILIVAFGVNSKYDQDFEIRALVKEVASVYTALFSKVFKFTENTDSEVIEKQINELAERLKLPDLIDFDENRANKIDELIDEVFEREEEILENNLDPLSIRDLLQILADKGFKSTVQSQILDQDILAKRIAEFRAVNPLDQDPNENTEPTQPMPTPSQQPTAPTSTTHATPNTNNAIDLTEFNQKMIENHELLSAVQRLGELFMKFRNANEDLADLAVKINEETTVGKQALIGFCFYGLKQKQPDPKNIVDLLISKLKPANTTELIKLTLKFDEELKDNNIY